MVGSNGLCIKIFIAKKDGNAVKTLGNVSRIGQAWNSTIVRGQPRTIRDNGRLSSMSAVLPYGTGGSKTQVTG